MWINLSSLYLYGWIDWYGPILYGSQKVQVHRERDEVTFHQRDVKEIIYDHYLTELATASSTSYDIYLVVMIETD